MTADRITELAPTLATVTNRRLFSATTGALTLSLSTAVLSALVSQQAQVEKRVGEKGALAEMNELKRTLNSVGCGSDSIINNPGFGLVVREEGQWIHYDPGCSQMVSLPTPDTPELGDFLSWTFIVKSLRLFQMTRSATMNMVEEVVAARRVRSGVSNEERWGFHRIATYYPTRRLGDINLGPQWREPATYIEVITLTTF